MSGATIRKILLDEIQKEVFGPHEIDETFKNTDHPKSRYLSGVLYPIQMPILEEDDNNESVQIKSTEENAENEKISINVGTKPSSMGLSCKIPLTQKLIQVTISYGRYILNWDEVEKEEDVVEKEEDVVENDDKKNAKKEKDKESKSVKQYPDWKRVDHKVEPFSIDLTELEGRKELEPTMFFRYFINENKNEEYVTLNVFLTNETKIKKGEFIEDHNCIFQPKIRLT